MKNLPNDWYARIAEDKVTIELTFDHLAEVAAALQQLQVDRRRADEDTCQRNNSDQIDFELLTDFVSKFESILYSYRDQKFSEY